MIAVGSDHAGFELKQIVMAHLKERGEEFKDYGTYTKDSCDYPDYAEAVSQAIIAGEADKGILICGTGIGISIAANRHREIRAALCGDCFSAEATREHNDANVLAMGARVVADGLALKIVDTFLDTPFSNGANHVRRVAKLS
ncbi:MAG: ribose 5-phosphate isomerase B [Lachnospiraceae bacterium]|jgi:ribose 5-phosphate isomerase B|nr:ribose 5-phosphate isomerase B [Lachnospiraceae bacterium]